MTNTEGKTDAAKANLYVLPVYVSKTYTSGAVDIMVTNADGKDYWTQWAMLGTGVKLTDNHVETITSSDGYNFSKENAVLIAQQTAAWLTTADCVHTGALTEEQRGELAEYLQTYIVNNDLWTQA